MHPIKRAFLIFVFAIGTVGGFGHGFRSLGHCSSGGWAAHHAARRAEFEDHIAEVCTRAAERTRPVAAPVAATSPATPSAPITLSGPVTITVGGLPPTVITAAPAVAVDSAADLAAAATPSE